MSGIEYSQQYADDKYIYCHVTLPAAIAQKVAHQAVNQTLLSEKQWQALGVKKVNGWEHYGWHNPEPELLLFRRPKEGEEEESEASEASEAEAESASSSSSDGGE